MFDYLPQSLQAAGRSAMNAGSRSFQLVERIADGAHGYVDGWAIGGEAYAAERKTQAAITAKYAPKRAEDKALADLAIDRVRLKDRLKAIPGAMDEFEALKSEVAAEAKIIPIAAE